MHHDALSYKRHTRSKIRRKNHACYLHPEIKGLFVNEDNKELGLDMHKTYILTTKFIDTIVSKKPQKFVLAMHLKCYLFQLGSTSYFVLQSHMSTKQFYNKKVQYITVTCDQL